MIRRLGLSILAALAFVATYLGVVSLLQLDPDFAGTGAAWAFGELVTVIGGLCLVLLVGAVWLILSTWRAWVKEGDDG